MPRIIEVPTHLNVEDSLLVGLTARQILRLVALLSVAYGFWDQVDLPAPVRASVAALLALLGVILALIQPGGRSLDQWAFAAAAFALVPRRLVWRASEPDAALWSVAEANGWAEFDPAIGWFTTDDDEDRSHWRHWPPFGRNRI